jgi:hypothetical protein
MNRRHYLFPPHRLPIQALILSLGLWFAGSVSAQNLLGNPSFESPLGVGTTNWTIQYIHGGPDDFEIKDRTTAADRYRAQQGNTRGLHFRPSTWKLAHAYASQTISGLEPGHSYAIAGNIGTETRTFGNASTTFRVYFEAIGGLDPARSPDAPFAAPADNAPPERAVYSVNQTADADGKLEIRLHFDKYEWCTYGKLVLCNGYFDEFSVTY